jgi:hypothetical protein
MPMRYGYNEGGVQGWKGHFQESAGPDLRYDWAVSFWAKPNSAHPPIGSNQCVIGTYDLASNNGIQIGIDYVLVNWGPAVYVGNSAVQDEWNHVLLVNAAGGAIQVMVLNGDVANQAFRFATGIPNQNLGLSVGGLGWYGNWVQSFRGEIAHVAVWQDSGSFSGMNLPDVQDTIAPHAAELYAGASPFSIGTNLMTLKHYWPLWGHWQVNPIFTAEPHDLVSGTPLQRWSLEKEGNIFFFPDFVPSDPGPPVSNPLDFHKDLSWRFIQAVFSIGAKGVSFEPQISGVPTSEPAIELLHRDKFDIEPRVSGDPEDWS